MMNKMWSVVLVCALTVGMQDAFAKRMGGGLSIGKQSGNVSQRSTAPATPAQTSPQQAPARGGVSGVGQIDAGDQIVRRIGDGVAAFRAVERNRRDASGFFVGGERHFILV